MNGIPSYWPVIVMALTMSCTTRTMHDSSKTIGDAQPAEYVLRADIPGRQSITALHGKQSGLLFWTDTISGNRTEPILISYQQVDSRYWCQWISYFTCDNTLSGKGYTLRSLRALSSRAAGAPIPQTISSREISRASEQWLRVLTEDLDRRDVFLELLTAGTVRPGLTIRDAKTIFGSHLMITADPGRNLAFGWLDLGKSDDWRYSVTLQFPLGGDDIDHLFLNEIEVRRDRRARAEAAPPE